MGSCSWYSGFEMGGAVVNYNFWELNVKSCKRKRKKEKEKIERNRREKMMS